MSFKTIGKYLEKTSKDRYIAIIEWEGKIKDVNIEPSEIFIKNFKDPTKIASAIKKFFSRIPLTNFYFTREMFEELKISEKNRNSFYVFLENYDDDCDTINAKIRIIGKDQKIIDIIYKKIEKFFLNNAICV